MKLNWRGDRSVSKHIEANIDKELKGFWRVVNLPESAAPRMLPAHNADHELAGRCIVWSKTGDIAGDQMLPWLRCALIQV